MFRLHLILPRLLPLWLAGMLLAACAAPAAAPAGAPAAEEAPSDPEAPPINPAASVAEAAAQPDEAGAAGSAAPNATATGRRVFRIVPDQSVAQYAVEEEFLGQTVTFITAVGKTSAIDGYVALELSETSVAVADNQFTVDISTLTSDRPRRDQAIRNEWLESSKYPIATFAATEVTDLPADAALGKDVTFTVAGNLTVRDVTQPQRWAMTARFDGDTLSGTATTYLLMRDFGFAPPDIGGILKVTDGVTVTVDFVARKAQP